MALQSEMLIADTISGGYPDQTSPTQADAERHGTQYMGNPLLVAFHVFSIFTVSDFGKLEHAGAGAAHDIGQRKEAYEVMGRYTDGFVAEQGPQGMCGGQNGGR